MAKKMICVTVFLLPLFIILLILYNLLNYPILLSLTITAGTFLYHFAMRLSVGYTIDFILKNKVDYTKKIFQEKKFEKKLYKFLKIDKLKINAPTFAPENFDLKTKSLKEVIMATCQAELVHKIIIILSFIPLLFSLFADAFWVFFITSLLSALYDGLFVAIQRYNRPRLVRILKKTNEIEKE